MLIYVMLIYVNAIKFMGVYDGRRTCAAAIINAHKQIRKYHYFKLLRGRAKYIFYIV